MLWGIADKKLPFPVFHHGHLVEDFTIRKLIKGHEPETYAFFKKQLQPTDVVADVGAHNGEYAVFFADRVAEVHSYEPDKIAYKKLQRATTGMPNVFCNNIGVSNKNGIADLQGEAGSGLNSLLHDPTTTSGSVSVPVMKLPDLYTWAKIDVEGAELLVLEGMTRRIKATVEFSPKNLRAVGIEPTSFISDIESFGYHWFAIDEHGDHFKTDVATLLKLTKGHSNIYLEPK